MSACPFCGYENHPRHDCKAKERAAQELIRLRDEVDGLRAERDEARGALSNYDDYLLCDTCGNYAANTTDVDNEGRPLGHVQCGQCSALAECEGLLSAARAQIKAAKAYLYELAAHDAAFPANPLEISQWTRKGVDLIARANKVFS